MLTPISDDDWPETLAHLKGSFTASLNVYRTMAHSPALLAAWQDLRAHIVTQSALAEAELEVVILRTGLRRDAKYELAHHIVRSRKAGLSDARITSILGEPAGMVESDAVLARAVDALCRDNAVPPDIQESVSALYGTDGLLDLIATVGFYTTLAFIVKSFDTPVDEDVAAAIAEDPLATD